MDCNNTILDLRGSNLNIIILEVDTLNLMLAFKDDAGAARDMSGSDIELWVNDIKVADELNGITVGGIGNNEVTVVYNPTEGIGIHEYYLKTITSGVGKGEIYGKLTIKEA